MGSPRVRLDGGGIQSLCTVHIGQRRGVLLLQLLVVWYFARSHSLFRQCPFGRPACASLRPLSPIGHDYLRHPEKMMMMGSRDARHLGQEKEEVVEDGYTEVR